MPRPLNGITDAKLSVMEVLWSHEHGVTVREIVLAIYGKHEHSLHAGVKSFLDRLMEKGYVTVNKSDFAHQFCAQVTRQEFVGGQLKQLAESHFGGSVTPMLMSLVEQAKLVETTAPRSRESLKTSGTEATPMFDLLNYLPYAETLLAVVDFATSSNPLHPTVAVTSGESRSLRRRIRDDRKSQRKYKPVVHRACCSLRVESSHWG